ncbi:deoxycytidylate deaminase [Effusibacillus dendaii]|uniref:dCMP deaminase n=1 Tax=Effusibacillus dendaii TaxID=2743772 RepID=A0A7I8DBD5_9BACL|nr:deaminase [Effusibacillus dendaii]BCJ87395.1 dCMP deaminase [Effusibacillus dendaii]
MRPIKYSIYMNIAIELARASTCRVHVGCVVVGPDGIIHGLGYNGSLPGHPHCEDVGCDFDEHGHCKATLHAERNALRRAGEKARNGIAFVTHFPCPDCAKELVDYGISAVLFQNDYRRSPISVRILERAHIRVLPFTEMKEESFIQLEEQIGWRKPTKGGTAEWTNRT